MRIPLLLGVAALALAGCCTNKKNQGAVGTEAYTSGGARSGYVQYTKQDGSYGLAGFEAETTTGRSEGYENDLATTDPRGFQNWRFGGDTDRIAPRLPTDPKFAPTQPPVLKLPPN